jgi:hypothetical protein
MKQMAQAQTQQTKPATANPAQGGRPGKAEAKTPRERALVNLQYALDRACSFIHDGSASYARRARTAARQEVSKETVLKGLVAIRAAADDAARAIERAYAEPTKPEAPKSRVSLA